MLECVRAWFPKIYWCPRPVYDNEGGGLFTHTVSDASLVNQEDVSLYLDQVMQPNRIVMKDMN